MKGRITSSFIELFWKTIKYDYIYILENDATLYQRITRFMTSTTAIFATGRYPSKNERTLNCLFV